MIANPISVALTRRQIHLRDELVDLVLAEGFRHLTVDDIAGRLACSKRTLYALADSKEQLATLAVRQFFRRSTEQVEAAIARTRSPARRVARYLEAVAAALEPASRPFRDGSRITSAPAAASKSSRSRGAPAPVTTHSGGCGALVTSLLVSGKRNWPSSTTRTGERSAMPGNRQVSSGSSASAVPIPVRTASLIARMS
jgi:AcrR family transcriptional regulator